MTKQRIIIVISAAVLIVIGIGMTYLSFLGRTVEIDTLSELVENGFMDGHTNNDNHNSGGYSGRATNVENEYIEKEYEWFTYCRYHFQDDIIYIGVAEYNQEIQSIIDATFDKSTMEGYRYEVKLCDYSYRQLQEACSDIKNKMWLCPGIRDIYVNIDLNRIVVVVENRYNYSLGLILTMADDRDKIVFLDYYVSGRSK